jgi:hypothetical protein
VYSDTPAIDDGSTSAQLHFGIKSTLTDVDGTKTDKQFVEDNIRERGAMESLLSDSVQVEINNKANTILRNLFIRSWQSGPFKQQQNPAECRFQTGKRVNNNALDWLSAPVYTWLLCLMYVCYVLNRTYNETINGIPLTVGTGQLLNFHLWQKVVYRREEESLRYLDVSIRQRFGDNQSMISSPDVQKVVYRREEDNLRYLGVSIRPRFGDSQSMTSSPTIPHSRLHKRHTALSWHRVREAAASGIAAIYHIPGSSNPADILNKHWGYSNVWNVLNPLLFWKGDIMDIVNTDNESTSNSSSENE